MNDCPIRCVTTLATILVCTGVAAAPAAAPVVVRANELAAMRVVVVVEPADQWVFADFQGRRYAKEFGEVMRDPDDIDQVGEDAASERAVETGVIMFFASMGGGLIGAVQDAARERAAVEAVSAPVLARAVESRAQQGLDRAFADALGLALAAEGIAVDGAVELLPPTKRQHLDERGDAADWLARNHGDDARPILLVSLRQGLEPQLAGQFGLATAWLLAPRGVLVNVVLHAPPVVTKVERADYLTHHADGTPRKRPLDADSLAPTGLKRKDAVDGRHLSSVTKAMFVVPVPYQDLVQPPRRIVDERLAAIHAEYDASIEAQQDRDVRRYMKTQRNSELEAAPKWTPSQRAEYLSQAWDAPPGDVYPRLVGAGEVELARRIAKALVTP